MRLDFLVRVLVLNGFRLVLCFATDVLFTDCTLDVVLTVLANPAFCRGAGIPVCKCLLSEGMLSMRNDPKTRHSLRTKLDEHFLTWKAYSLGAILVLNFLLCHG